MIMDGDNVRHGLNYNLGLIVIVALISPYEEDRNQARTLIGEGFVEVHVNTPLAVCEERDAKGLYRKARNGEILNFTGISSPYEEPENPDLRVDTNNMELSDAVKKVESMLPMLSRESK